MNEIKDVSINEAKEEIFLEKDSSYYGTWKYDRELKKWVKLESMFTKLKCD